MAPDPAARGRGKRRVFGEARPWMTEGGIKAVSRLAPNAVALGSSGPAFIAISVAWVSCLDDSEQAAGEGNVREAP
jgi:hypothetical protein